MHPRYLMRLEHFPILVGIFFGVAGLALIADALLSDYVLVSDERRRRERAERHRGGEAALGVGSLLVGLAMVLGDHWRYGTVAFLAAVLLLGVGIYLNWAYVRGMALGRADAAPVDRVADPPRKVATPPEGTPKMRIR